jgi:hypothetical protein
MTDNSPSFRQFARLDDRSHSIPKNRGLLKSKQIVFQNPQNHPVLGTDHLGKEGSHLEGMLEDESAVIQHQPNGDTKFRLQNVFKDDKIYEHPTFTGGSVELEPRTPSRRDIPSKQINMHIQMGSYRRQQDERSNNPNISYPNYEGNKYSHLQINPSKRPRLHHINSPTYGPMDLNETEQARPGTLEWKNLTKYQIQSAMYEPRKQHRDFRFEKQKERQDAWQKKRDEEVKRTEQLQLAYLKKKQLSLKKQ